MNEFGMQLQNTGGYSIFIYTQFYMKPNKGPN